MSFKKEYRRLHRRKLAIRAEVNEIFDRLTPQDIEDMKKDIERFRNVPDVGILLPRTKGRKRKQYLKRMFSEENLARLDFIR